MSADIPAVRMAEPDRKQRTALSLAKQAQDDYLTAEARLSKYVREARFHGLPILYLADALGVSRSRIRVLARERS